jgi:hypothetical protein
LPALGEPGSAAEMGGSLEARHADTSHSVLVVMGVVVASLLLGYLTGTGIASPLLSTPLFCLVLVGALSWLDRRPLNFSAQAPTLDARAPGGWRILLVASKPPTVEQLQVLRIAEPRAILDVHAPVLRDHLLAADAGREIELARNRLRTALSHAERAGIDAGGEVGDPRDPFAGIEEQLRRQHVDEVILATHPLSDANPVEAELLERLRSQLQKPLTHVEVR